MNTPIIACDITYRLSQGDMIVGLNIGELVEVRSRLDNLGLSLTDLVEFMDRDKVQLFAELNSKIEQLENKLNRIQRLTEDSI